MATNDMVFNQAATILNSLMQQATGQASLTATDTSSFVTTAQTLLKTGYDKVYNAISQVLSSTLFSVRPYTRKFNGIEASASMFGNHVRKLAIADTAFVDSDPYQWPVHYDSTNHALNPTGNGESVDQQAIRKSEILQTNFYGTNVYEDSYTIFDNNLEVAFRSPEELVQFMTAISQNMLDKVEHSRETLARAVLCNYIGGLVDEANSNRVVHLITEYNTLCGYEDVEADAEAGTPAVVEELTPETVFRPENFGPFMKFVYSRIAQICANMTERSELYQTVVNSKHVMRHTPYQDQRIFIYAPARYQTEMMALADTYHDNYLKLAPTETVNFWQSIKTPSDITVKPGRIGTSGSVTIAASAVSVEGVFGLIVDKEALGYTVLNSSIKPAPYNARGEYQNFWLHEMQKCWNDHTEKGVVLLLD